MFANVSINGDTGNSNINHIYNVLLKNEPVANKGITILQDHPGMRLNTIPRRVAKVIANNSIIFHVI